MKASCSAETSCLGRKCGWVFSSPHRRPPSSIPETTPVVPLSLSRESGTEPGDESPVLPTKRTPASGIGAELDVPGADLSGVTGALVELLELPAPSIAEGDDSAPTLSQPRSMNAYASGSPTDRGVLMPRERGSAGASPRRHQRARIPRPRCDRRLRGQPLSWP
jgi:hypothetical protein